MRRHNLIIAFRNIAKYWNYSLINIGGLAIGLASFIFIILYIQDELKYDAFHVNADRIYRVNRLYNSNDVDEDAATCSFPCGPALVFDYPDIVKESVRFFNGFRPHWFFDYQKSEDEIAEAYYYNRESAYAAKAQSALQSAEQYLEKALALLQIQKSSDSKNENMHFSWVIICINVSTCSITRKSIIRSKRRTINSSILA